MCETVSVNVFMHPLHLCFPMFVLDPVHSVWSSIGRFPCCADWKINFCFSFYDVVSAETVGRGGISARCKNTASCTGNNLDIFSRSTEVCTLKFN